MTAEGGSPLVRCTGLVKSYRTGGMLGGGEEFTAVDGVDLAVGAGETVALVGESGCGKSTTGRLLLGLEPPTAGGVEFDGRELAGLSAGELRRLRRRMQMIFQDPYGSLNPRYTVFRTVAEPLRIHRGLSGAALRERVAELLEAVGLEADHAGRYPHEFSGGQRQRVAIARAISVEPDFVVADEPVSALDISIQGQILRLLVRLRRRLGMAMLFISHDLAVVRQVSDRVAVMYRGRLVELAPPGDIFDRPRHPYTRLLLDSVLLPDPSRRDGRAVEMEHNGRVGVENSRGCAFAGRCLRGDGDCMERPPELREVAPGHFAACLHPEETAETAAQ